MTSLVCQQCGKSFDVKQCRKDVAKYCSRSCVRKALSERHGAETANWKGGRVPRVCELCGESFTAKQDQVKKGFAKYCSIKCRDKAQVGEAAPRWDGGKVEVICERCGKPFCVNKSRLQKNCRYCSSQCAIDDKAYVHYGEDNNFWINGGIERTCETCGKQFKVSVSTVKSGRGRFCSISCKGKAFWKGGKNACQNRYNENPRNRLSNSMRAGIWETLSGGKSRISWQKLVGYSATQLKEHLESQFTNGMTWDNYGEWHVDHIRPISDFNFDTSDDPEFHECWSLWNLQPLWAKENVTKGGRCYKPPLPLLTGGKS